jgi:hypothetical protein
VSSDSGSPRCLNGGADLTGQYCSQCGQEDSELRVSLKRLVRDFMAEQLGLESKVPTTLWRLMSKPGVLTKEYLAGKRVRSLLPLRLYLSASVVYFLLLSVPFFGRDFKSPLKVTGIDAAALDSSGLKLDSSSTITIGQLERGRIERSTSNTRAGQFVKKRMQRFGGMTAQETVEVFKASFIRYMPNAIFLLLPIFTLILYLLYRKSGRFFAEHLIFTLHVHAFAFVALMVALALPDALDIVVPLWLLYYLYRALRVVYEEPRGKTIGKFFALLFSYMLIFQITMLAVLGFIFAVA